MNRPAPTLAVVISNFNYARFLPQTIKSVIGQTTPFDEIIVVDDGSTDNSREVIARYADHVTMVTIPNGGQMGACRAGLAASTSDYIYFLDADDYADPDLVAQIRPALASRPAKVQFQLHSVDSGGTPLGSIFPTYPAGYNAAAMRQDNAALGFYVCPTTSGNVFSRAALKQLPLQAFDPRGAFDGSAALAMPYLGEIIALDRSLAYYRVHESSLSSWGNPTSSLLTREIEIFDKTWAEVLPAIGLKSLPFTKNGPLYINERRLMIACQTNKFFVAHLAWRYAAGILRSRLSLKQKTMLVIWAMALQLPSVRTRNSLIRAKRSAANRSHKLRALVNFITGNRSTRRS